MKEVVFTKLGVKRKEIVLGPAVGFDGAVIDVGNKSLIVSMDPVTGAIEQIGWLAVNINANDVATFGVEPTLFSSCILLPENADKKTIETICTQMDEAAKNLGIAIVGGHCETTPGLTNPIVVGCTMGVTDKGNYVTAGGAKHKDMLILTKSAGIEGTAILASEKEEQLKKALSPTMLQNAKKFYNNISVVKDALTAIKIGGVNAMHDPTEGGLNGGVYEMADASNVGVVIYEKEICIKPETSKICEFFKIDPLHLISSGALLISAEPKFANKIIGELRNNQIHASIIGEFLENPCDRMIIKRNEKSQALSKPISDHLWLALKK